jgi:hypothetical protein
MSNKRSEAMYPEAILSDQSVQRLISDPSLPEGDSVIFYFDPSAGHSLSSTWLTPMVTMEFSTNPRLGMVYGTEAGYVWISSNAIRAIQEFAKHKSVHVRDYTNLIVALESLGYAVKQAGEQQPSKTEIEFKRYISKFVKTTIIAMIVGFAIGVLIGSRFESWLGGGGTWLIGGSAGALIAFLVTSKYLSARRGK